MHRFLEKQIKKASNNSDSSLDVNKLIELIDCFYEDLDKERRIKDRSLELMSEELNELNRKLKKESENQLQIILEHLPEGIIFLDEKLKIVSSNNSARYLLSPIGDQYFDDAWNKIFLNLTENFFKKDRSKKEVKQIVDNNREEYLEISLSHTYINFEKRYLLIIRNITKMVLAENKINREKKSLETDSNKKTLQLEELNNSLINEINERKAAEVAIEFLAFHDSLTGLLNRNSLNKYLQDQIILCSETEKLGLLYVDLERFKVINDRFGHIAGDELIKGIASRLIEKAKGIGKVFRAGGDEFAITIYPLESREQIEEITKGVLEHITKTYSVNDQDINIEVIIGASIYPDHAKDAEELIKNADIATMNAKEYGSNFFKIFNLEMSEKIFEEYNLERNLKKALSLDQILIYFQPKINLERGKLSGLESLIRWNHPELGFIPPTIFIPVAERKGFIIELGEWMLFQACETMRKWLDMGFGDFTVAVNLSTRQFEKQNIDKDISRILASTGLPAQYLELEITEGAAMRDADSAVKILRKITDLGVKVSLDDFGTGYSSLSYLKKFPLSKLKIDRSFITGIPEDTEDMAITRTIVELARSLDLTTIAEGVETDQQLEFLKWVNCDEVQGYIYSPPVPTETITLMLVTNSFSA